MSSKHQQSISSWKRTEVSQTDESSQIRPIPIRSEKSISVKSSNTVQNFTRYLPKPSKESVKQESTLTDTNQNIVQTIFSQEFKYGANNQTQGPRMNRNTKQQHNKSESAGNAEKMFKFQPLDNLSMLNDHQFHHQRRTLHRKQNQRSLRSAILPLQQPMKPKQLDSSNNQHSTQINYNQIFLTSPLQQQKLFRQVAKPSGNDQKCQNKLRNLLSNRFTFDHIELPPASQTISKLTMNTQPTSPLYRRITLDGQGTVFHRMKHQQYENFKKTMADVKKDFESLLAKQQALINIKRRTTKDRMPHNVTTQLFQIF